MLAALQLDDRMPFKMFMAVISDELRVGLHALTCDVFTRGSGPPPKTPSDRLIFFPLTPPLADYTSALLNPIMLKEAVAARHANSQPQVPVSDVTTLGELFSAMSAVPITAFVKQLTAAPESTIFIMRTEPTIQQFEAGLERFLAGEPIK